MFGKLPAHPFPTHASGPEGLGLLDEEVFAQLPAMGQAEPPRARLYGWLDALEVEAELPAIARLKG